MESIDPSYQPDAQNRRCALHAAAQRGLLEICYMLVQVRNCPLSPQRIFPPFHVDFPKPVGNISEGNGPEFDPKPLQQRPRQIKVHFGFFSPDRLVLMWMLRTKTWGHLWWKQSSTTTLRWHATWSRVVPAFTMWWVSVLRRRPQWKREGVWLVFNLPALGL